MPSPPSLTHAGPPAPAERVTHVRERSAKCVSCGNEGDFAAEAPYRYRSDAFRRIAPNLELLRCTECDLVQVDVQAIDQRALLDYYRHSYRNEADIAVARSPQQVAWFEARGRALAALCRRFAEARPLESIFEVGAGYGYNLNALRQVFPDSTTYTDELDGDATARSDHVRAKLEDRRWDIVLLSHVLEHFVDPSDLLETVQRSLRPSGLCVLEVPNEEPAMLARHEHLEPHLTFFRVDSLRRLLERGFGGRHFEVLEIGTAGPKIESTRQDWTAAGARLARAVAARLRIVQNPHRFNFENDTPNNDRIFLRAVLRVR